MKQELGLYIIAKELHLDIDEVKSWSAEKLIKWSIALKLLAEELKKQSDDLAMKHLFVFR